MEEVEEVSPPQVEDESDMPHDVVIANGSSPPLHVTIDDWRDKVLPAGQDTSPAHPSYASSLSTDSGPHPASHSPASSFMPPHHPTMMYPYPTPQYDEHGRLLAVPAAHYDEHGRLLALPAPNYDEHGQIIAYHHLSTPYHYPYPSPHLASVGQYVSPMTHDAANNYFSSQIPGSQSHVTNSQHYQNPVTGEWSFFNDPEPSAPQPQPFYAPPHQPIYNQQIYGDVSDQLSHAPQPQQDLTQTRLLLPQKSRFKKGQRYFDSDQSGSSSPTKNLPPRMLARQQISNMEGTHADSGPTSPQERNE